MLKKIGTVHSSKGWSKFIDEVLIPMDKEMKSATDAGGKIISFTGGDKSCNVYAVIKDKETKQIIIDLGYPDNEFEIVHD